MITALLNPYVWGGALLVLALSNGATFWKTWSWRDATHRNELLVAQAAIEERVRKEEAEKADANLRVERESVDALKKQVAVAGESIMEARNALRNMPKCPVARDVVRVLQPSTARVPVREDPAPAAAPNAPAVGAGTVPDETVDAAALLETCKRNYESVCIPNKLHVLGLQAYVREVCTTAQQ